VRQVLVACRPVHELQRGAEGDEDARGRLASRVRRRRRVPRRGQWDSDQVRRPENGGGVGGRAVLRRLTLARRFHREKLLFPGLRPR
jgi:hypothetical protein